MANDELAPRSRGYMYDKTEQKAFAAAGRRTSAASRERRRKAG